MKKVLCTEWKVTVHLTPSQVFLVRVQTTCGRAKMATFSNSIQTLRRIKIITT